MTQERFRIYDPLRAKRHELCHPADHDDFETIIVQVNGTPRQAKWEPLAMELIREDEKGRKYLRSDSPWLGTSDALIFRPTAILAMGQLLRAYGELLPLRCEGNELWMFNPRLVDALDEEASTIKYFSDGDIMDIKRYVFRPEVVRGVHAFKIPQLPRACPTFVSQEFVDQWSTAQLKGLTFTKVWEYTG